MMFIDKVSTTDESGQSYSDWYYSARQIATMIKYNAIPGEFPEPYDSLCVKAIELMDEGINQIDAYHQALTSINLEEPELVWKHVYPVFIQLSTKSRRGHRVIHCSDEAFDELPDLEWIVDGLIAPGNLALVYGKAGIGKSYALMHLATCIALGIKWLKHDTKQSAVLYVDEESGLFNMKQRIRKIFSGLNVSKGVQFRFLSLECFDFLNDQDISDLQWTIKSLNAKVIFIDTWANVLSSGNENAVGHVQPIFQKLRTVVNQENAAIIFVHHPNKGGRLRGSTAIEGAMDMIIRVSRWCSILTFKVEKIRDTQPTHFASTIKWTKNAFAQIARKYEAEDKTDKKRLGPAQDYIIKYLAEHGISIAGDIAKNAKGCSSSSIRQALRSLAKAGYILNEKRGIYEITEQGRKYLNK